MAKKNITIKTLGSNGDGLYQVSKKQFFIPQALTGEVWLYDTDSGDADCIIPLPERVVPSCNHFPECGGCTTQHMPETLYKTWKVGLLNRALYKKNIVLKLENLVTLGTHNRRRCILSACKDVTGKVTLGYHRMRSKELIALKDCIVLIPKIVQILPGLQKLVDLILKPNQLARVTILQCEQGLDVDLALMSFKKKPEKFLKLAQLVDQLHLTRLTINSDVVILKTQPTIRIGKYSVPIPNSNIFLQPVQEAEREIRLHVSAAVGKAECVADLFCGVGSFTFDLAQNSKVLAIDNNKTAINALRDGYKHNQGLKPIKTLVRDLFKNPLTRRELENIDAVVFDPPRAGAERQAFNIAKSRVPNVVVVSCNHRTLARDLKILIDGGYQLVKVQPIDQFIYTPHLECVAVLKHPSTCTRSKKRYK
ncbi:MAG: 23S rRNA (uracil(1939)-C(5))-methyltransferase RlmD [Hyphomicrobiaceae bacterium hypho_1]